jgi:cation:H+ antiporter
MFDILYVILGIVVITLGANMLVDGASSLAKRLKIPDLIIGLTIVAFGTSAPELTVSLTAAFQGSADIAIGNVLGSNIFNIFGILGICAIIYPLSVASSTVRIEIPLSLLAAIALAIVANDPWINHSSQQAMINRSDGLLLLLFFSIFLYYTVQSSRDHIAQDALNSELHLCTMPLWKSSLWIFLGLAGLIFGGQIMVHGAINIARTFGLSESLIGLTIVAIGTSVPELATSIVAALKKNTDIAIGNIVGSNIFNSFLILGASALLTPLPFNGQHGNIDISLNIFASFFLLLCFLISKEKILKRQHGLFFITIYIMYMLYLLTYRL